MMSPDPENGEFTLLAGSTKRTSKRLIFSYVLDWAVIIVVAVAGAILYKITGSRRAFSLDDASISYPLTSNTLSITVVGIVACAVPAVVIAVFSLLIPGPWSRRLWEWHAGWLGLGLSLAGAFFVTSGLKDVVGKPRPDLLARCMPDIANVAKYVVGGTDMKLSGMPIMVDSRICTNPDTSVVKDGFAAFPSGHSSFAWAGLLYFSLWLGAKFAVSIPALFPTSPRNGARAVPNPTNNEYNRPSPVSAPPLYLLALVSAPAGTAIYICATRYANYMHAGWDIMGGSIIGIVFAILGFVWYHAPVGHGQGAWAWSARSRNTAFWAGYGAEGFASNTGMERDDGEDMELGDLRRPGRQTTS